MSQKSPPTYSSPKPPTLATASDLYGQGQDWYQKNQPLLYNAQSTALGNANNPDYYNQFGPTSLQQALGDQYFKNVWPDEAATIRQQFSQSGLSSSPALAETLGRAQGGLETQVGSYLSSQAQQEATNAINAGLGITQSSLLSPFVQTGENQSNAQANLDYQYQQALAQQQYQQTMNKYQSQQAMASTIGQISPIGGQIYGASTGTSGSAFGGSAQTFGQMAPLIFSGMTGGAGGLGAAGMGGASGFGGTQSQFGGSLGGYNSSFMSGSNGASNVYGPAQTSSVSPKSFQF